MPSIAEACVGDNGEHRLPDGWQLYVTPPSDPHLRSGRSGVNGVIVRTREGFQDLLFGREPYGPQLTQRMADVAGTARLTTGVVAVPTARRPIFVRALSHLTDSGRGSTAITNMPYDRGGQLGLGVDGLFGSVPQHEACRERAVQFTRRFELQPQSVPAARAHVRPRGRRLRGHCPRARRATAVLRPVHSRSGASSRSRSVPRKAAASAP